MSDVVPFPVISRQQPVQADCQSERPSRLLTPTITQAPANDRETLAEVMRQRALLMQWADIAEKALGKSRAADLLEVALARLRTARG